MIPVLDLAAAPPAELAARIDQALCSAGFFAVRGHGVPAGVVQAAFEAGHRFFALPQADKERWHMNRSPKPDAQRAPHAAPCPQGAAQSLGRPGTLRRGFDPIGLQALDPSQPPDVKESFYLGVEAIGPNQWPDESLVPGFRAAMQAYATEMEALARRLMALFERALQLPAGHFDGFMRHPTCTTRLLHYPPQPAHAAPGQIGCGAHTDWGALTLLAQDDAGGLQVQLPGGEWMDVPPAADTFVVNVGDMMQRWTNDRWPSTMHRVINRHHAQQGGRDRWSIAYFFDLDAEAQILPLPTCVSAQQPARYGPITAGEHLEAMYRRTTVAA